MNRFVLTLSLEKKKLWVMSDFLQKSLTEIEKAFGIVVMDFDYYTHAIAALTPLTAIH